MSFRRYHETRGIRLSTEEAVETNLPRSTSYSCDVSSFSRDRSRVRGCRGKKIRVRLLFLGTADEFLSGPSV